MELRTHPVTKMQEWQQYEKGRQNEVKTSLAQDFGCNEVEKSDGRFDSDTYVTAEEVRSGYLGIDHKI